MRRAGASNFWGVHLGPGVCSKAEDGTIGFFYFAGHGLVLVEDNEVKSNEKIKKTAPTILVRSLLNASLLPRGLCAVVAPNAFSFFLLNIKRIFLSIIAHLPEYSRLRSCHGVAYDTQAHFTCPDSIPPRPAFPLGPEQPDRRWVSA